MDALTHRLAAALGNLLEQDPMDAMYIDKFDAAVAQARTVHAEYDQRCKEQAGIDHYHGREGG